MDLQDSRDRVVVIVGRPNVGKSAIFNRLAKKRASIVHSESGVTRDRLMREVEWDDQRFELVDTGGIAYLQGEADHDVIQTAMQRQVETALESAAVAILVVDLHSGILPMDRDVAARLRACNCRTIVAANKADDPQHDVLSGDCESLGFPVFPVSALHDRGFGDLMPAVLDALPEAENTSAHDPIRVAIVGRPNVGKSSYINRLLRSDRVIVSSIPGTTRDTVDVPFTIGSGPQARHYVLSDTAGMRRVGKIDNAVERFSLFRAEQAIERCHVAVLVLDATQGPTQQDKKIAALINKHNRGCLILINKWDLSDTTQRQYGPEVKYAMPFMGHCPFVFASAESGFNIRRTIEAIDHVSAQTRMHLPTGVLNRCILNGQERVRAQVKKGKRLRLYYSTQVDDNPIRIRIYVNDPRSIQPEYRRYLQRCIREWFGLEGAPIILLFSARRPPRRDADGR
jgi:GTP-binding protein